MEDKIKEIMIKALEEDGEFVCHADIPETPFGFDGSFSIVGDDDSVAYTVLIKKVEL